MQMEMQAVAGVAAAVAAQRACLAAEAAVAALPWVHLGEEAQGAAADPPRGCLEEEEEAVAAAVAEVRSFAVQCTHSERRTATSTAIARPSGGELQLFLKVFFFFFFPRSRRRAGESLKDQ